MNFLRKLVILYTLLTISSSANACSQNDIKTIEGLLNNSKAISGGFTENNKKTGSIYIKKPGMMRIDYESPEKISILIKDSIVTYYDYQLDELTKIKQDPTFLTFLTKDNISFKKDFKSFRCETKDEEIIMFLSLIGQENEKINLRMYYSQYILNKVDIRIENGKTTTLAFNKMNYNSDLNRNKFILRDRGFFNME
jgi:outer membrane lipoprotein-sorting protein